MPRHFITGFRSSHTYFRRALISSVALALALAPGKATGRSDRLDLFPKLQAGQTITYRIAYRVQKQAKTQSSVVMAQAPGAPDTDVEGLLRLEILGVEAQAPRSTIHARTSFETLDVENKPAPAASSSASSQASVEFTMSPNGRIGEIKNLDVFSPEEQQAWQQWASTFGAAAAFPADGIKLAEKWKSEEPEKSPSPVTGLVWLRESAYLRNEPCGITQPSTPPSPQTQGWHSDSNQPAETCAVIQTTATLKQKSSQKDTTPEDFKLHHLRTTGTASGSNKTLLYISLTTGLVIRSSDQADQSMHVTIAKSNGSNRLHYDLHAKSNTEIFQVANITQTTP
jgi:hypothetical protein